jgi:hypothetical protein
MNARMEPTTEDVLTGEAYARKVERKIYLTHAQKNELQNLLKKWAAGQVTQNAVPLDEHLMSIICRNSAMGFELNNYLLEDAQ